MTHFSNVHKIFAARRRRASQRGSILVQFALAASVLALMLGTADLGFMFYAKRDLQRIADLAAIEAVNGLGPNARAPGSLGLCQSAGQESLARNLPLFVDSYSRSSVLCGIWDSKALAHKAPQYFETLSQSGQDSSPNAAHVELEAQSLVLIPGLWSHTISAEAIAKRSEPMAAFQVGSQLLNLNANAPLGKILKLVGVDVDKLSVLDWEGLANAKITPSGLLKALGVNLGLDGLSALSPQEIAKLSNLTLLHLLDASLKLVGDKTLEADIKAIIDLLDVKIDGFKLLDMKVPLLGGDDNKGLLTFLSLGSNSSPNFAALDVQLGLADILQTAILVGANGHALQVKELNVLNLVKTSLTVVEPPTIAVGPIGTKANSAQIRLNIDIDSNRMPLLGDLLNKLLKIRINLPIKIDSVSADAKLEAVYCPDPDRDNKPSIDLGVNSRVAKIVIGHPDRSATDPENTLIKTPLAVNVRGPITASVLEARKESINLIKDELKWSKKNSLLLGNTVEALTNTVFNLLGGIFTPPMLGSGWSGMSSSGMSPEQAKAAQIEMLAEAYLEETKVNGFYNVDAALDLLLNGKGDPSKEGYMPKLVNNDFRFNKAIPTLDCVWTLGLYACPTSNWSEGSFSEAFTAYTSKPMGLLNIVGIPLIDTKNGYYSCAGLLSSLLSWNTCVLNNLNSLLKNHSNHANLTDGNALVNSLKDKSSDSMTCSGALCIMLKPILQPLKWLLNGLGEAILSPLLTKVLGLNLGQNEVKALEINCEAAQIVY
ncbi:TadE/TadG family type IV pilus assembly protein [Comamonas composti]|uniref:TadE/TadG family type IV pilus assembly protein n=1 Tax=Comamonas composti TaxID=408558 RepID=UPI000400163B|nr:TadE/TadG family type IV pilus assembly protein [Comamonas composti]